MLRCVIFLVRIGTDVCLLVKIPTKINNAAKCNCDDDDKNKHCPWGLKHTHCETGFLFHEYFSLLLVTLQFPDFFSDF